MAAKYPESYHQDDLRMPECSRIDRRTGEESSDSEDDAVYNFFLNSSSEENVSEIYEKWISTSEKQESGCKSPEEKSEESALKRYSTSEKQEELGCKASMEKPEESSLKSLEEGISDMTLGSCRGRMILFQKRAKVNPFILYIHDLNRKYGWEEAEAIGHETWPDLSNDCKRRYKATAKCIKACRGKLEYFASVSNIPKEVIEKYSNAADKVYREYKSCQKAGTDGDLSYLEFYVDYEDHNEGAL